MIILLTFMFIISCNKRKKETDPKPDYNGLLTKSVWHLRVLRLGEDTTFYSPNTSDSSQVQFEFITDGIMYWKQFNTKNTFNWQLSYEGGTYVEMEQIDDKYFTPRFLIDKINTDTLELIGGTFILNSKSYYTFTHIR